MTRQITESDERRIDPIVEDDTRRGWRVREVPEDVRELADQSGVLAGPMTHLRLVRLNGSRRRKITEVVQRAWVRDMEDPELWSDAQVLEAATKRGTWSADLDKRIEELRERTTGELAAIYAEGQLQRSNWVVELEGYFERFRELVDEAEPDILDESAKLEMKHRFERWFSYHPDRQAEYQSRYPEALVEGLYYPDKDLAWMLDRAPTLEAADILDDVGTLIEKVNAFTEARNARAEYLSLVERRLRLFANTIESRQSNAEEMATIYFTSARCDEAGHELGPITPKFDDLYELPDEVIRWLVNVHFYFHRNIPDELVAMAELQERFPEAGTTGPTNPPTEPGPTDSAPPSSTPSSPEASDGSPEAPSSSTDGAP